MKNKKWLIIGAIVVVLGVIGMFVDDDIEETPQTTSQVSQNNNEDEVIDVSNLELSDVKYEYAIKSINKYMNQYPAALESIKSLCYDLAELEENFAKDLRHYL